MKSMRVLLLVIGILAIVIGALWAAQGVGIFPYPASSFMINESQWAYYGTALAILGLVFIGFSRRA